MDGADDVASRLRDALAMWRGHPYADVETHGYLDGEITRLSELRLSALEARIDADLRAGRHGEVVAELDALTVEHPYREHLQAMHMLALYRSGRQAEALRAFGRTRDVLVEGLGIDPTAELKELERRILAQDRDLLLSVGPKVLRRAVLVADLDDAGWSDPAEREIAFARREAELASAAAGEAGIKLAPKGTAGYVVFAEPIQAVRAARARRRRSDPGGRRCRRSRDARRRAGRATARPVRLVSSPSPTPARRSCRRRPTMRSTRPGRPAGAPSRSGRVDIVGLDPGIHVYQLVGHGFGSDFPDLRVDRLPPPVPSWPGTLDPRLRAAGADRRRRARRGPPCLSTVGRP